MIKKVFRENWIYIVIIILLTVVAYILGKINYLDNLYAFDMEVLSYLHYTFNDIKTFMIIMTNIGYWYVPVLIIVIMFFIKRNYSYVLAACYASSGVLAFVAKLIVAKLRPVSALIEIPSSFSFPSGHTLTSICFYFVFAYLVTFKSNKYIKTIICIVSIILGLTVGLSRIYLGVHYCSDVIGGIIFSIPIILMFVNIINKHYKEV